MAFGIDWREQEMLEDEAHYRVHRSAAEWMENQEKKRQALRQAREEEIKKLVDQKIKDLHNQRADNNVSFK